MKSRLRRIHTRTTAAFGAMHATSTPVRVFVAIEAATGLLVGALAVSWAIAQLGALDLDRLPPWPMLAAFLLLGAVGALVRALRPDQAVRRWHGVLVRRIDEWFA